MNAIGSQVYQNAKFKESNFALVKECFWNTLIDANNKKFWQQ